MTGHAQSYPQRTDVPSVYIETENRRSITSKEQYINCTFIYVDGDSLGRYENTLIRGRGNSTWWNSDKKSFRVKFEKKQRLLGDGFANAKSWTLLANHGDKTMIRNALTYDLGRFMGMKFCPAARFVDLYLNGNYQGTYQISDQVQVHKKRVEVDEDSGWLLEVANENSKEEPLISSTGFNIMYNIKNPKDQQLTVDRRIAIGRWIQQFESAVASHDYCDPEKGWRAYVDEEDFINWYVGAEITGNIDALYSIYMYKEADDQKMHFGPLWDLDLGYDNSSERSLLNSMEAFLGLWNRPFEKILQRLWQDPWFVQACNDRLRELTDRGLQAYLLSHIDSLRTAIWQTQTENFKKWRINQKVYDWAKHSYYTTYDGYISELKSFVNIHIPYLQRAFAERQATAIRQFENRQSVNSQSLYDLQGRRITSPDRKGIYIQNHQKFVRQ
ncbi:MAG: CotH kinase family protein [Prevotella sp.]|nr:CotH kinase family protein [Prevotella sp.]MBR3111741.1 CotH kinase family protein [Prevotella sp.]